MTSLRTELLNFHLRHKWLPGNVDYILSAPWGQRRRYTDRAGAMHQNGKGYTFGQRYGLSYR